jgi:hypothetical protein
VEGATPVADAIWFTTPSCPAANHAHLSLPVAGRRRISNAMTPNPLTPERARRELRHLLRLRDRADARWRISRIWLGSAGFVLGLLATAKTVAMPVSLKVTLAALLGLALAFPDTALWLLLAVAVIFIGLMIAGLAELPCADCSCPGSCDTRNARRRKLDAMISVREHLLNLPRSTP